MPSKRILQRACSRASLTLPAVALGIAVAVGTAPSGAVASRPEPIAVPARTLYMVETANLHLVSRTGHVLNYRGSISGTLAGSVYTRSIALSTGHGEGTYTFYPKGGSISGKGTSSGHVVGTYIYFAGVATITGGNGTWAHASSSGMRYSGVVNRQNLHITERFAGNLRY
ncbi:MAG: hypothetical protein ACHQDY_04075 [Solirubrobacterales bacterium]